LDRDLTDHFRFCPIQSDIGHRQCSEHNMPIDLSTGVLIDEKGAHRDSTAILRILPYLGLPYVVVGRVGLSVPRPIRDFAYRTFAKNRGKCWKFAKGTMGIEETYLEPYRDRIKGLKEPLDPSWGFRAKN